MTRGELDLGLNLIYPKTRCWENCEGAQDTLRGVRFRSAQILLNREVDVLPK